MELQHKITSVISLILATALIFYSSTLEMKSTDTAEEGGAWYNRSDTIYFWYSDEAMSDYINKAAVSFGEENNVHVLPVLITNDNYLEAINEASIENNQLPDAYILGHESLEMAFLAGLAVPIDDPERKCNDNNFSQAALNAVKYNGRTVGYPLSYDTCALVYNEDYLHDWASQKALAILKGEGEPFVDGEYFEEIDQLSSEETGESTAEENSAGESAENTESEAVAEPVVDYDSLSEEEQASVLAAKTEEVYQGAIPETLNELLTIADSYSAPAGVDGVMSWDVSDILYNFWIIGDVVNLGGESGDDKNNIELNNTKTVNALLRYQHLHHFFNIDSALNNYDKVISDFIDGKMIFTICSVDGVAKLKEAKENGSFEHAYGFAPIPEVDETTPSRSMSMTEVVVINGYSEKKEIANAFARYLTCEFSGELYARSGKAACFIGANDGYENISVFDTEYADSVPLPKIIELENFWMELEAMFARVWEGDGVEDQLQGLQDTVRLFFTR